MGCVQLQEKQLVGIMKKIFYILPLLTLGFIFDLTAQTKDVENMWKQQQDTCKISYKKQQYLEINEGDILKLYDNQPNFGMYKDNYFITGIPTNKPVTNQNADAKFQISIRQRLLNSIMPFHTQLMLIYTQKSFWDIYTESSPFSDNNYNSGFLVTMPVVHKNKLKGMLAFSAEHESNGKNGDESRSWNYLTLSGLYFYNMYFSVQAKVWYGMVDDDNPDLFKYKGYGLIALNYRSPNSKLGTSLVVNPCSAGVNTQLEISFKPLKKSNQYLFLQWYQGYGENLLEYNRYTSMVRIGICMKPPLRDLY